MTNFPEAKRLPSSKTILEPSPFSIFLKRAVPHLGLTFGGGVLLLIFFIAIFAPILAPHDPYEFDLGKKFLDPVWHETGSWEHPLGTDLQGRDYLSRMIYGAQLSLLIGFASMLISGIIGTGLGVAAGYFGGRVDMIITFLITTRLAMPVILVALAVVALIGSSTFIVISFFYVAPIIINFSDKNFINKEFTNNSKNILNRTLNKDELIEEDLTADADERDLLYDILEENNSEINLVRYTTSEIESLFEEVNYNLKDVRDTKLVKPIDIGLLPNEIKNIGNTKKRKDMFIKIVLPLIVKENNKIRVDRKRLFTILNKNSNTDIEKKWLEKKYKQYGVRKNDLSTLKVRMDEIPVSLAIAQAAKETGWGTSRFALKGNALFGQWTWSGEGIKPAGADTDATYKVMKFNVLKASVRAYQRNLNTHSSYKKFRFVRAQLRDDNKELDSLKLADYLENYAQTGTEYTKVLKQIIQQNQLKDFDEVKLLPLSVKYKNII